MQSTEDLSRQIKQLRQEQNGILQREQNLAKQQGSLEGQLVGHETRRDSVGENLEGARGQLPEDWRQWSEAECERELPSLKERLRQLDEMDIDSRFRELQTAQTENENDQTLLKRLECQIAEFPESARRDPGVVAEDRNLAQQQQADCEEQHQKAKDHKDHLSKLQSILDQQHVT